MMKPRKRINPISDRQKERLREYAKVRKEFLAGLKGCWCPVALIVEGGNHREITEIHHRRGKVGSLLCDARYFMGVSRFGHRFIHEFPDYARKHGWLCEVGQWNRP